MNKYLLKNDISEIVEELKNENKKIVFTNGCFDILHVGHVRYLNKSAEFGDVLIIGLNSDASVKRLKGETRQLNNENDRAEVLLGLKSVDYVVLFDENTPENLLEIIKPDVYTKGADYTLETLPEAKTVIKNGGRVEFIEMVQGKSTTNIINSIKK